MAVMTDDAWAVPSGKIQPVQKKMLDEGMEKHNLHDRTGVSRSRGTRRTSWEEAKGGLTPGLSCLESVVFSLET